MSPTRTWVVVLNAAGEVIGAEGSAPPGWIGATLHDRSDVPGVLRDAARALSSAVRGGEALAKTRVEVPDLDAAVELVAIPAIGLHRTATDLRALLHHSMAALGRQARALDVGLSITVGADVPAAFTVDPEKIAWAISALAGNAMRYARCGTRHMPGGSIAVTASRDAARGELILVVEDDGPGIPEGAVQRMFDRAPGAPHAVGLALSVVRDIVTAHGGSMDVESSTHEIDHGTTVTLRLPLR